MKPTRGAGDVPAIIRDSSTTNLAFTWAFTLFWNAIAWAMVLALWAGRHAKHGDAPWLVWIFPLLGTCFILGAIHATARRMKFGRSEIALEVNPPRVGGWLAGTIRTAAPLRDTEAVRLTLRCIHRETRGTGKHRRTSENTIWEAEQVLAVTRMASHRGGGSEIPVAFHIPSVCRPSFDSLATDIVWRLEAHAAMPGADYTADFRVPVSAATEPPSSQVVPKAEHAAARVRASRDAVAALEGSTIELAQDAAGRWRMVFPASRTRKAAAVFASIALALAGAAAMLVQFGGPVVVVVILGGSSAMALSGAVVCAFRHVELQADRHGVERRWRLLALSSVRHVAARDITALRKKVTSQVGNTPYYTILATTKAGGEFRLVSTLRTIDADHIMAALAGTLGVATGEVDRAAGRPVETSD